MTGEVVKSGIDLVASGVKVLKEGYDVASPVIKQGLEVASPVVNQVVKATTDAAAPALKAAAPALQVRRSAVSAGQRGPRLPAARCTSTAHHRHVPAPPGPPPPPPPHAGASLAPPHHHLTHPPPTLTTAGRLQGRQQGARVDRHQLRHRQPDHRRGQQDRLPGHPLCQQGRLLPLLLPAHRAGGVRRGRRGAVLPGALAAVPLRRLPARLRRCAPGAPALCSLPAWQTLPLRCALARRRSAPSPALPAASQPPFPHLPRPQAR